MRTGLNYLLPFCIALALAVPLRAQTTQPAANLQTITLSPVTIDNAPAITRAASYLRKQGGIIKLSPGVYPVRHMVTLLDAHNVTIEGYGATLVAASKMSVGGDGQLIAVLMSDHISILGLGFDGSAPTRGFHGDPQSIIMATSNDVLIQDCSFKNAVCDDILMWGNVNPKDVKQACQRVRITGCVFDGANRNAISVVDAAYVRIDHNIMRNCRSNDPQAGVDVEPNGGDAPGITHDVMIDHNLVSNCGYALTTKQADRPSDIWIVANRVERCRYGIGNEAKNCHIEWNVLEDLEKFDISSGSGGTATIQNNTTIKRGISSRFIGDAPAK